jgi:sec-independent protein translocase protein TatC
MVPPEETESAAEAGAEVSPVAGAPLASDDGQAGSGVEPAPQAEPEVLPGEGTEPGSGDGEAGVESAAPADSPGAAPVDYNYYDDPYADPHGGSETASASTALVPAAEEPTPAPEAPAGGGGGGGGGASEPGADEEEDGMVRMSFFDHLAELRRRIFYALGGLLAAFAVSLTFASTLWNVVSQPAVAALKKLGVNPPVLVQITPLEYFNIVWLKLPLLASVFLASPWLLYQLWAFIAPGLYRRERRWAAPFVISTAGLFVLGGVFAYFVVFRFALVFLLGLGIGNNVQPMVSVDAYFSVFFNVMMGVGVVFELPVLIFFLTLIGVLSPGFLMRNVRYAILAIFALAAIITPTPDVFNLVLFALPMCALFFVGIGASYILVLRREKRKFPWGKVLTYALGILAVIAVLMYVLHRTLGYHFVSRFPWFVR